MFGRPEGGKIARKDILAKFGITDRADLQVLIVEKHGLSVVDVRSPEVQSERLVLNNSGSGPPRDKRGLQVMLSREEVSAIDNYRFEHRMPSRAAAFRELLRRGLAAQESGGH